METMDFTVCLRVTIARTGANLNEVCKAAKETIQKELPARMVEAIVHGMQEEVLRVMTGPGEEERKQAWGSHEKRGTPGIECESARFERRGYRPSPREVKTDLGTIRYRVAYVRCLECGTWVQALRQVLEIEKWERHSGSLERMVMEAVRETSYGRGEREVEARGGPPVPRSSAHRWVGARVLPERTAKGAISGMADGTAFKKWPGKKGELRVVLGLGKSNEVIPLGCYAGETWEEIGKQVAKKLKREEVQLELFAMDGELGLDEHLGTVLGRVSQRCTWHAPRQMVYALWRDKLKHEDRGPFFRELKSLIGIEIPAGSWEAIAPEDKQEIERKVAENKAQVREMIDLFRKKGYQHAAVYLERSLDRLYSNIELWLKTGIIAPRTTSILENIFRELGRRIKKLGYNWSDKGAAQMSRIVLLQHFDAQTWSTYWQQSLNLRSRCTITIEAIQQLAA